jgi:hypothetical protein
LTTYFTIQVRPPAFSYFSMVNRLKEISHMDTFHATWRFLLELI